MRRFFLIDPAMTGSLSSWPDLITSLVIVIDTTCQRALEPPGSILADTLCVLLDQFTLGLCLRGRSSRPARIDHGSDDAGDVEKLYSTARCHVVVVKLLTVFHSVGSISWTASISFCSEPFLLHAARTE